MGHQYKTEKGPVMSVAFMLNADDWLSSSDIASMGADEERGFMRLLMHLWKALNKTGEGLPNDEQSLARWAMVSLRTWRKRVWPKLQALFEVRNGRLYNARLQAEYENYKAKSAGRSEAASTAAKARWQQRRGRGMERAADTLARMPVASATHPRAMRSPCATHPTSEQSTEYKQSEVSVTSDNVPSLPFKEKQCGTGTGGPMNAEDVRQARELLKTVAKKTALDLHKEPDWKIAAHILQAAGSVAALVSHLAEIGRRNLNHVDSYGYFLRAIEARITQTDARAG